MTLTSEFKISSKHASTVVGLLFSQPVHHSITLHNGLVRNPKGWGGLDTLSSGAYDCPIA